ncbi:HAD hydrolase-like protein [Hyphomonas sp.]|uniref:HAD hydrolase-like protein n=1 Tax=Hyphomonas sp. TaxID=87 RepID=UPI0025C29DFD|nr:HAD hydrolase-like protein [Hyphomonas sp.]MBI1399524.1 HAD hydrolase-like protein [Hyphomonas sp.]
MNTPRDFDLVIFDFDGTLADSAGWFRSILPDLARRFGFRCPDEDELEVLRHKPPRDVMRILKIPHWKLVLIAVHVRKRAAKAEAFPLFGGVPDVLRAIAARGIKISVVSSNAEGNVRRALGPELSALVTTWSCGAGLFGKAKHFRDVLRATKVAPERALSIGDEIRDIEAARDIGLKAAAVTWGFGMKPALEVAEPDVMFESVNELQRFFEG